MNTLFRPVADALGPDCLKPKREDNDLQWSLYRLMAANPWRIKAALGLETHWFAEDYSHIEAYSEMADDLLDAPGLSFHRRSELRAVQTALDAMRQQQELAGW